MTLYTVREAASVMRISHNTLRRAIKLRRIEVYRPSPQVIRITPEAIETFLERSAVKPAPQWRKTKSA